MFVLLCAGQDCPVASAPMADKIEWCGGEYDVADLKAALAVLLPTGTPQDQLLAQEYSDPWAPDSWDLLGPPAQSLLKDLAQATFNLHVSLKPPSRRISMQDCVLLSKQSACSGSLCVAGSVGSCGHLIQLVEHGRLAVLLQNEWELPGAVLLNKAEAMSEMFPELKPSRVCRAHHLFAGATLLLRCCADHQHSTLLPYACFSMEGCEI